MRVVLMSQMGTSIIPHFGHCETAAGTISIKVSGSVLI